MTEPVDAMYNAPFLPTLPHSWEDLRKAVRSNLDATVDLISPLPTPDITLSSLEGLKPGTYALKQRPSVELLRQLTEYKNGSGEVGLICINGKWLISLNESLNTHLPNILTAIQHDGIFQADIHSHPGDDPGSEQPSDDDIFKLDSTIDGRNYILSRAGVIEFQRPRDLPGGYTKIHDAHKAWTYWIRKELKLTEDKFDKRGGWELKRKFYETFFRLRVIPWENISEIEEILSSKEQLQRK